MRPRTRDAVSGVFSQIGLSTLSTSGVSIAATGERAERRIYEPDEASDPLLPVARTRPACFIVLDEALGALLERHGPGVCGPKRGYARALGFDGIDAVETKQASLSRLLAGLGERERMNGAKAHIAVA